MRVLAIVLGMAFLAHGAALGASTTPSEHDTAQPQSSNAAPEPKRDDRGTDNAPLIVKNYPQQSPEDVKRADDDRRARVEADRWAIIIGEATIAIGLLTCLILVVQALVFGIQAKRLRESVKEMQSATEATMKVAGSLKSSHRAWLIMEEAKIRGLDADGSDARENVDAVFRIENRGSPALVTDKGTSLLRSAGRNRIAGRWFPITGSLPVANECQLATGNFETKAHRYLRSSWMTT